MNNKEIEYYEFRYKIPKYKIKPPLDFSKYYEIHKDEIIIDLQQENEQLKDNWNKLRKYISSEWYCFDNESMEFEVAKSILNKMQELEQGSDK